MGEFRLLVKELKQFQSQSGGAPPTPAPPTPSVAPSETVGQVFTRFDTDESGDLDVAETKQALNALGLASDTAGAAAVLAKYDADGNGRLSKPEFRLLVKELKQFQAQSGGAPPTPAPPTPSVAPT